MSSFDKFARELNDRIDCALAVVRKGIPDGDHHKMWIIDQMVRELTACPEIKRTVFTPEGNDSCTYTVLGESEEYVSFRMQVPSLKDGTPHEI